MLYITIKFKLKQIARLLRMKKKIVKQSHTALIFSMEDVVK